MRVRVFTTNTNGEITDWAILIHDQGRYISTIHNSEASLYVDAAIPDDPQKAEQQGLGLSQSNQGKWIKSTTRAVPEIDPTSGTSALALLAGFVLVIRGGRKK